jgi:RND family efflux transporter MFP subunit
MKYLLRCFVYLSIITLFTSLGCTKNAPPAYAPPPPPEVTVVKPVTRMIKNYLEYTGNLGAYEYVELKPRIKGFIEKIHFRAGDIVKANDLLFSIDRRPYKVMLDKAEATLKARQALLVAASDRLARARAAGNSTPISEVITYQSESDQAKAQIEEARAQVADANLELSYCEIRAPIGGVISRNLIDVGTLVDDKITLASVASVDKVYAYFNSTDRAILEYIRKHPEVRDPQEARKIAVFLGLEDELDYPHEGRFDSQDNIIDPDTGTIRLRALLENPTGILIPGLNIRVRIPDGQLDRQLIPPEAIAFDQQGKYVLVVNAENEVERKPVNLGRLLIPKLEKIDSPFLKLVIVLPDEQGKVVLAPTDRIIIRGVQKARPGAKVNPTEFAAPAAVATAS